MIVDRPSILFREILGHLDKVCEETILCEGMKYIYRLRDRVKRFSVYGYLLLYLSLLLPSREACLFHLIMYIYTGKYVYMRTFDDSDVVCPLRQVGEQALILQSKRKRRILNIKNKYINNV